jgi:hypothetical protein
MKKAAKGGSKIQFNGLCAHKRLRILLELRISFGLSS